MIGFVDMGGGMRGIYGAGVADCFLENDINFDYCIGVSAGSANIASFLAGQKGRNYKFYTEFAMRKEYMGFDSFFKNGSFFNLDYVYSVLSNSDGEYPLDYDAMMNNKSEFAVVATDAATGRAEYFYKNSFQKDNYAAIKASSCVPVANKPYFIDGKAYYDGGVSDPIPFEKAFADGCDKVVVVLTKPRDFIKKPEPMQKVMKHELSRYPNVFKAIENRHNLYNESVKKLLEYEKEGRAVILAPDTLNGMNMTTKNHKVLDEIYQKGFDDALKIIPLRSESDGT